MMALDPRNRSHIIFSRWSSPSLPPLVAITCWPVPLSDDLGRPRVSQSESREPDRRPIFALRAPILRSINNLIYKSFFVILPASLWDWKIIVAIIVIGEQSLSINCEIVVMLLRARPSVIRRARSREWRFVFLYSFLSPHLLAMPARPKLHIGKLR